VRKRSQPGSRVGGQRHGNSPRIGLAEGSRSRTYQEAVDAPIPGLKPGRTAGCVYLPYLWLLSCSASVSHICCAVTYLLHKFYLACVHDARLVGRCRHTCVDDVAYGVLGQRLGESTLQERQAFGQDEYMPKDSTYCDSKLARIVATSSNFLNVDGRHEYACGSAGQTSSGGRFRAQAGHCESGRRLT
jgi:hypothetical protein